MFELVPHRLRQFGQLDLHRETAHGLHVVLAQGRGSGLIVPAQWMSLCWAMRGDLRLQSGELEWHLGAGHGQAWGDGVLRCRSSRPQAWLMVTGPRQAWPWRPHRYTESGPLLPWQARMPRGLAHGLIALAAPARDRPRAPAQDAASVVMENIAHWQSDLHGPLARCAGRTQPLRHQTMTRLLRVRHAIHCDPGQRLDLDALARLANYSPCHLLRMHRRVFGETPFEYASRLRDRRALELIRGTDLSILDISLRLGYENQSAFCRAFKTTFGATPTGIRRHALSRSSRAA